MSSEPWPPAARQALADILRTLPMAREFRLSTNGEVVCNVAAGVSLAVATVRRRNYSPAESKELLAVTHRRYQAIAI